MDRDTQELIGNFCKLFELSAEIEFTCYDAYEVYFKNYFIDLKTCHKKSAIKQNCNGPEVSHIIDRILVTIDQTALLHILALLSIVSKYVNGSRNRIFEHLPQLLSANGTPYNSREIRFAEYAVFRNLNFHIDGSITYKTVDDLLRKITITQRNNLRFCGQRLFETCIDVLRFIYMERNLVNERIREIRSVETHQYGLVEDEIALGAATVHCSAMKIMDKRSADMIFGMIIQHKLMNERFLKNLSRSIVQLWGSPQ